MVSYGGVLFGHEAARTEESEAVSGDTRRECSPPVDQGVLVSCHDETYRHTKGDALHDGVCALFHCTL